MYGVNILRRMLVKEAFISVGIALSIVVPVKLFLINPSHQRLHDSLDFGEKNLKDLGNSLV